MVGGMKGKDCIYNVLFFFSFLMAITSFFNT